MRKFLATAMVMIVLGLGVLLVPSMLSNQNIPGAKRPLHNRSSNFFTLTAVAADKHKVTLNNNVSFVIEDGMDRILGVTKRKTPNTEFSVVLPVVCEGNSINKITYSINKGYFMVVNKTGKKYVIEGIVDKNHPADKRHNYINMYKSITISSDFQTIPINEGNVSICDEAIISQTTQDKIWGKNNFDDNFDESTDAPDQKTLAESLHELYDGYEITCTVTFNDGTTDTKYMYLDSNYKTIEKDGDAKTILIVKDKPM